MAFNKQQWHSTSSNALQQVAMRFKAQTPTAFAQIRSHTPARLLCVSARRGRRWGDVGRLGSAKRRGGKEMLEVTCAHPRCKWIGIAISHAIAIAI